MRCRRGWQPEIGLWLTTSRARVTTLVPWLITSITIDFTYHAILLAALTTTLVLLALRRARAASGQAPERQRVRSR